MSTVKQSVREVVEQLPEDCTWEDVKYQLYVRQKIERGLADSEAGRTVSHEEVRRDFRELGRDFPES